MSTHVPVLLEEVVRVLAGSFRQGHSLWLDATLGLGGHAEALLLAAGPGAQVVGIDKDPEALKQARRRLKPFGKRVRFISGGFEDMAALVAERDFNGVLFDLGLSSLQLDSPQRGFSFRCDGPLDMRLDPSTGEPAWSWLRRQNERSLEAALKQYGEEPRARLLARRILEARPSTTAELSLAVGGKKRRIHPATRVFQAIRIAVNGELQALEKALPQAVSLLKRGGQLAVISFHSLEDRRVKAFMARESRDCLCPPGLPQCRCSHLASLRRLARKALRPSRVEIARNPRSRSARLRLAERI